MEFICHCWQSVDFLLGADRGIGLFLTGACWISFWFGHGTGGVQIFSFGRALHPPHPGDARIAKSGDTQHGRDRRNHLVGSCFSEGKDEGKLTNNDTAWRMTRPAKKSLPRP